MVWVTLGLGSSVDPVNQLSSCLDELLLNFNELALSWVFESESIGFVGDNFLNMVVGFDTEMPLDELFPLLKKIEDKIGIDREKPRFSARKIDIDLLTYGNRNGTFARKKLPRPEIIENAYVLWPLSQVSPDKRHPGLKATYKALWKKYYQEQRDAAQQKLWPISFSWHGRKISQK